jgi:hypothetical protein
MDKSELDLIIKVQLFAHRNNSTGVLSSDLDMDSSWDLPMAWANKNVFLHIW